LLCRSQIHHLQSCELIGSWRGIVGEGMPLLRAPQQKGTLFVKFDVEFPIAHFHNDHPHLYQALRAQLSSHLYRCDL
jgi:hypothetical protein